MILSITTKPDQTIFFKVFGTNNKLVAFAVYFGVVWLLSEIYHETNTRVLEILPCPATLSMVYIFIGFTIFLPIWFFNPPENLSIIPLKDYIFISIANCLGLLGTAHAFGSGTEGFINAVKCSQCVSQSIFSVLVLQQIFPWEVYCSLFPIITGVALASVTEIHFTWLGFFSALLANFTYELRIVMSKSLLSVENLKHISPADLFRVLTLLTFLEILPVAIYLEGHTLVDSWLKIKSSEANCIILAVDVIIAGFAYYLHNEGSFWILGMVSPLTVAVFDTLKLIILLIFSTLIFFTPISMNGATGCLLALVGTFFYVVAQNRNVSNDDLPPEVEDEDKNLI